MEDHRSSSSSTADITGASFSGEELGAYEEIDAETQQHCSICLNDMSGGESCRRVGECGHSFHSRCIGAWLESHSTCPLCRAHLPQIISLNQNQYDWNDFVSTFLLLINDFLHKVCNPPLNEDLSSMLCGNFK